MLKEPTPLAQGPGTSCNRQDGVLIAAPTTAFLDEDEARWIVFVNLHEFWSRDHQEDYTEATEHILDLLGRYLDAIPEDPDLRSETFGVIATEINKAMIGLNQIIVPNTLYRPGANWNDISDRISTKPFLLGNLEGVAGAYASLGRFLTSRYVVRLKRCQKCKRLFIAPTEEPWTHCPRAK